METIDSPESIAAQDHWSALFQSAASLSDDEKQQAEEQEQQSQEDQKTKENEISPATAEFIEDSLGFVFSTTEVTTSMLSGVSFKLDEVGKQKVTEAAIPVIAKHGGKWLTACGNYFGELALLYAVFFLVKSSREHLAVLKEEKRKQEKEKDEKEVSSAQAAQSY